MSINNSDTAELLTRELGARVVVHDPAELPPISEYGFNIKVQDYTSVEVSRKLTKRLGPPWGSCVNDGSHLPFEFPYRRYNQVACKKLCKHTYVGEICNCTKRSFLMGQAIGGKPQNILRFCKSTDSEGVCVRQVLRDIDDNRIDCKCAPPCKEKQYSTSLSTSSINTDFFRVVKGVRTLKGEGQTLTKFDLSEKSTMLGLKVYYRTLQVESFEEVPSYSWETLVANVGGNLGFFMGLSIVTFVEVCEFLWDVSMSLFRKNKIRNVGTNKTTFADSFSRQLLSIGVSGQCTAVLQGGMRDVDVAMSKEFEAATRTYKNPENIPISRKRMYSRRLNRLRTTSSGRNQQRIRPRMMSTNMDCCPAISRQNLFYKDFVMENADIIVQNRKREDENNDMYF